MDKRSKILLALLFIAVAVSIYLTYDRAIVRNDFDAFDSEAQEI